MAQPDCVALRVEYNRLDSLCRAAESNKPAEVIGYSKKMLDIGRTCQVDTLILLANQYQGQALHDLGMYDAALKIYYENLALAEKINHCTYHANALYLTALIWQIMADWSKSQSFCAQAKQRAIDCGRYTDTISINYEIGFNEVMQGQVAVGIARLRHNLDAARQLNDPEKILYGIDNLANVLAETGDYRQSLAVLSELLRLPHLWPDNLQKTGVYEHLAELHVKLEDWDNAQRYQHLSLQYAKIMDSNDWLFECYKLQSWIDEGRGRYRSALQNHRLYVALKDSVYQSQYGEKMAAMYASYDLAAKQQAIALLEKDARLRQEQYNRQRLLLLAGLLTVVVLWLLGYLRRQYRMAGLRAAFTRELLRAQEQERQRIARELHDSVGQNVLFIKNRLHRLGTLADPGLMGSVDAALSELRTISKNLYPNQLEQYGLQSAVEALCEMVRESSGIFVSSDLQYVDEKLSREGKINCYRIIQECLNNAIKHAEATAVRITASLQPGQMEWMIQDNGKGFDKSQLQQKSMHTFGLMNIEERIKMMNGKLDIDTAVDQGVKVIFAIPC